MPTNIKTKFQDGSKVCERNTDNSYNDDYDYYEYAPTSCDGFCVDLGLFASVKRVTLNLGVNTIGFKYWDMNFGLGVMF